MTEAARKRRNKALLRELHPDFAAKIVLLLAWMGGPGSRPRLQDGYRDNFDQADKFYSGLSEIKSGGPHTYFGDAGPASLAVHILDDNNPIIPSTNWIARLAVGAHRLGLQTGCAWAKDKNSMVAPGKPHRLAIEKAIADGAVDRLEGLLDIGRGFDPLHIEHPDWRKITRGGK